MSVNTTQAAEPEPRVLGDIEALRFSESGAEDLRVQTRCLSAVNPKMGGNCLDVCQLLWLLPHRTI